MAALVWDDVVAIAPELAGVAAGAQTAILGYVNESLNVAVFGGEEAHGTRLARSFLAAHLGSVAVSGGESIGVAGELKSETVGPITRSYSTSNDVVATTNLSSSSYGQIYLALVKAQAAARLPIVL